MAGIHHWRLCATLESTTEADRADSDRTQHGTQSRPLRATYSSLSYLGALAKPGYIGRVTDGALERLPRLRSDPHHVRGV
jgi:hypothetical protein